MQRLTLALLMLCLAPLPAAAQPQEPLIVFAAASLTDAFEEIAAAFEARNAGVEVLFNFAGSSALAAQLVEGGAPADVFASANPKQMQVALEGGRIGAEPVTFARNRLVLIVPADNSAGIESLDDLANDGLALVVAAPDVPIREYTEAMFDKLAADPAYGPAYRQAVIANIVSEEENVRLVAAKVALGEADAGIVYTSDVTPDLREQVIALPIPDAVNTTAAYPIAITNDSPNPELAQAFVDFALAEDGQAILLKWGFIGRCPVAPESTPEPETTPEAGQTPEAEQTPEAAPDTAGC